MKNKDKTQKVISIEAKNILMKRVHNSYTAYFLVFLFLIKPEKSHTDRGT